MRIVYRELLTDGDINQCVDLQRHLFKLSDIDIVSPQILKMIIRGNPPLGIVLGVFNESNKELIGFIITMAMFDHKSIYGVMVGVKPQYQNKGFGLNIFLKLREVALEKGIDYFYGVFEPLKLNLAHLYINRLGFKCVQYQVDDRQNESAGKDALFSSDKMLLKWDLNAYTNHNMHRYTPYEVVLKYPVVNEHYLPSQPYVLVEIPSDIDVMQKEDCVDIRFWQQHIKSVFTHYINGLGYIVDDCFTIEQNQIEKSYYLLKKS